MGTATVAKDTDFRIGSAATPTTKVDVSNQLTDIKFGESADLPDATTFNSGGAKSYAKGLVDSDVSLEFNYTPAIATQMRGLLRSSNAADFQFGPLGSTTGNPKYSGQMFINKVDSPAKVGDILKLSVSGKVNGSLSESLY